MKLVTRTRRYQPEIPTRAITGGGGGGFRARDGGRSVAELIDPNDSKLAQAAGDEGAAFSQAGGRTPEADWLSISRISEQADQLLEPFATTVPLTVLDRESDAPGVTVSANDWVSSGLNRDGRVYLVREGLPDGVAVVRTV